MIRGGADENEDPIAEIEEDIKATPCTAVDVPEICKDEIEVEIDEDIANNDLADHNPVNGFKKDRKKGGTD